MPRRDRFAPEERQDDIELYDVAPPDMPPSPAGANAAIGGEAAASRRLAGLPPELLDEAEHQPGTPPVEEPFLGYDSLTVDDVLDWIDEADPDPAQLRAIVEYEEDHERRELIIDECKDRLDRLGYPLE